MKKLLVVLILFSCLLLACTACSSGTKSTRGTTYPAVTATGSAELRHTYGLDKGGLPGIFSSNDAAENSAGYAAAPAAVAWSSQSPVAIAGEPYSSQGITDRMVVRTGNIQMVVNDISASMDKINGIAAVYGGYVVTSQQGKEGERNVGSISIRIKAENYDKALVDLRALAKSVTFESTSTQDVTEEYIDLEAKEKNLEATETQLRKIMEGATKTEDVLSIQRELTSVRTDIEQAKGRMQYLERTSSTSLIQIRLEEAVLALKFTADKVSVGTDEVVRFTSEIAGGFPPYSYQWDFGDGKTSNEASPSHAYKKAGTYFVSLRVSDDKGYANTLARESYVNVLASWKPGSVASSAWNGFSAFGRGLANVLIWLGIFSPVWIVIGGIIWWFVWRKNHRKA